MTKLAIAIPTYNRAHLLQNRLKEFINFKRYVDEMWIADNSDSAWEGFAGPEHSNAIKYVHNSFNIGGGANFLKVLTLGSSAYVWLRGDDDPITLKQVEAVSAAIKDSPDIIILSRNATKPELISNIRQFFDRFNISQASGWISMCVFKQTSLSKGLQSGYWGVHTGWPHFALLLGIFQHSKSVSCLIYPISLEYRDFREEGRSTRKWSIIKTCVDNFPSSFELINDNCVRRYAYYQWRKNQSFNLVRSFVRSRLGLSPFESVSLKTISNLLSITNPRSSMICFALLIFSMIPRTILTLVFAYMLELIPYKKLILLELTDLHQLKPIDRYLLMTKLQRKQKASCAFV